MQALWCPRPTVNPSSASPAPCDLGLHLSAPCEERDVDSTSSERVDELNELESGKRSGKCLARLGVWEYY